MAVAPPNAFRRGSRARTRSSCFSGSGAGPSARWPTPPPRRGCPRWQWAWVTGTEGSLGVDHRGRALWLRGRAGRRLRVFVRDRRGLVAQMDEFVAAVREGRPPASLRSPPGPIWRWCSPRIVRWRRAAPVDARWSEACMTSFDGKGRGRHRRRQRHRARARAGPGPGGRPGRRRRRRRGRGGRRPCGRPRPPVRRGWRCRRTSPSGRRSRPWRTGCSTATARTHLLCNNAGVVVHGGLESATWQDWQWVLGVNLWGVIHGLLAFVPRMIAGGEGGHVVNTASMAGLIASQGLGVYNTTKYAVVGLSETLAKDLRPHGIGVTVVCPMGVATRIREADRNRPAGPAKRARRGAGGRDHPDRAHARSRGRGRPDPGGGPRRRALRHHARRGARAAAAALPAPGGRRPEASTSLTPPRATAILSASRMDERDVVRDLVAKLMEAVEASLDGSPAVREALGRVRAQWLRPAAHPPRRRVGEGWGRGRGRRRAVRGAPRGTDRRPGRRGRAGRRVRGGAGPSIRADEARPRLPADGAHPAGERVAVPSAAGPRSCFASSRSRFSPSCVFLILRASVHGFLRGLRGGGHPRPTRRAGLDELVKDPVCETYIPRRKAITRGSGPERPILLQRRLRRQVRALVTRRTARASR